MPSERRQAVIVATLVLLGFSVSSGAQTPAANMKILAEGGKLAPR